MPNFMETLRRYWQKRLIRILVALLVLGGAIYLQYRLANIPLPVDVEDPDRPYTPLTAELIKQEILVVDGPIINRQGPNARVLFAGDGAEAVAVEVRFDSARIGQKFINILRTDPQQTLPPETREPISYVAQAGEEAKEQAPPENAQVQQELAPCRTALEVSLADNATMPRELHFFQKTAGSERHRPLEIRAVDSDLLVRLETRNFAEGLGTMRGKDCNKSLTVGSWNTSFSAPIPIDIVVPAGSSFRLSFTGAEGKLSSGKGDYEPFKFVALPLNARAVRKMKESVPAPTLFEAARVEGQEPLVLKHLRVGSEQIQLDFAGQAMVQQNGKFAVTFNLLQFAKDNPILAGILAMFDAALLEWIRRTLMGSRTAT
jgi:hypothetical protein